MLERCRALLVDYTFQKFMTMAIPGDYVYRDGINSLCIAKEWFVSGLLAFVLLCLWRWMALDGVGSACEVPH